MIIFLAIMCLGVAGMLGLMGIRQFQRRYFVAAGFSLIVTIALAAAGATIILKSI